MSSEEKGKRFLDALHSDLRALSNETRKKFQPVKEAAEAGIHRLRTLANNSNDIIKAVREESEVIQPFLLGCDTKSLRVVQISLTAIQRLISHHGICKSAAENVVGTLWQLMESGLEELRILQTVIVLLTSQDIVRGDFLGKAIVLCFRLYFTKDPTVSSTAAAAVRQTVSVIFERVVIEDTRDEATDDKQDLRGSRHKHCPNLRPCGRDAYLLFQDLCQLTNGEQPYWLSGMIEMTRTFGLELLESILRTYPSIFLKHPEFSFLLKERLCPLVIKLFSPSIKYRQGSSAQSSIPLEKPIFPVSVRLLRIVSVLIEQFYTLLVTECEIFLSLLVKFLDIDKPFWQRALALEVLYTLCVQPPLLRSFCQFYDMQEHSTKIFSDIVNALDSFIQSLFSHSNSSHNIMTSSQSSHTSSPTTLTTPTSTIGGFNVVGGTIPQPGFLFRGVWIPVETLPVSGSAKAIYLEQLDRTDAPIVTDSYAMCVGFACLLETIKSIDSLVQSTHGTKTTVEGWIEPEPKLKGSEVGTALVRAMTLDQAETQQVECTKIWQEMINSSWCGILAGLSILLDSSTDETATESILKSFQTFTNNCGLLNLNIPRDAFITALCKSALPTHYALTVLGNSFSKYSHSSHTTPSVPVNTETVHSSSENNSTSDHSPRNNSSAQVGGGTGAVVTSMPLGSTHGPVSLTSKNIQCMRAILALAHCHGGVLGSAWHMVLTTLQHLTWILGLKPSTGGSLKALRASEAPNLVITQTMMADLPVLSAMLSRLFESSQYLDDVAVHHLVDALCRLSAEAMEQAHGSKEPSLFAVAKLLETGLNNLHRTRVLWKPLTAHLLEVCQHPNAKMREWGAEAVTSLVRSALSYHHSPPLTENVTLQGILLSPLQEMSMVQYHDVRHKQLECVLQILHSSGQNLGHGWPVILGVIGAVTNQQGENLIRVAFQSLQLVVTDFLPIMPCTCLRVVVDVAGRFGLQPIEINISLTAIGLLWNISDFLSQHRENIKKDLERLDRTHPEMVKAEDRAVPPADRLWMCLFARLGDLCVDPRPAVRKSAGQTLFSTISAHGSLLEHITWYNVLWQVLFPLLERVKTMSSTAADIPPPSDTARPHGNILVHHSRDTAEKQWAETRVLTLAGVARVFNSRREILSSLEEFPRAWALLLEFIESAAVSRSSEVSLAALKSFQNIVQDGDTGSDNEDTFNSQRPVDLQSLKPVEPIGFKPKFSNVIDEDLNLWLNAWRVWYNIGVTSTSSLQINRMRRDSNGKVAKERFYPAQPLLTALVQIFPLLFQRIYTRFGLADLQKLSKVLQTCIAMPVHVDASPFLVSSLQDSILTPLQQAVVTAVQILREPVSSERGCVLDTATQPMYPTLFSLLIQFVEYACVPPEIHDNTVGMLLPGKAKQNTEWVIVGCVPFSEKSLNTVMELFQFCCNKESVIQEYVMEKIIKNLHIPLKMKYECPAQSLWKLAVDSLITVVECGLPVAMQHKRPELFRGMWSELLLAFEDFLFSGQSPPETHTLEQHMEDERTDIKVLKMIHREILSHSSSIPKDFMSKIMALLNRGSIHSATDATFIGTDASGFPLREEFAKSCFETLLQYSFIQPGKVSDHKDNKTSQLALDALLQRSKRVLQDYVEDERLSGKCPLPRTRMAEITFVIKAISTLLSSLKRTAKENPSLVTPEVWKQVVELYPCLVECTVCNSAQVRRALKEALVEFNDLLVAPLYSKLHENADNKDLDHVINGT